MSRSAAFVAVLLLATACGSASELDTGTAATSSERVATSTMPAVPNPEQATSPTTTQAELLPVGDSCDPELTEFVDAQFAFVGTVVDVRGEVLPWDVDPENPDRPEDPQPTRWVTFDVDGWYTNDWGTEFSVWMPVHDAAPGDRLAVGGDARFVSIDGFSGQSGEVEFCAPATDPIAESLAAWADFFGDPIEAGAATPEGDPDPADVAAIDEAEAAWESAAGDAYSYVFSMYERNDRSACGSATQRIVVTPDGSEATLLDAPRDSCDQSVSDIPTIPELFALARQVAGATEFDFRSNLDNGIVMSFYASDRIVEIQANVSRFSSSTAPTIVGWDDVRRAADTAATTWAAEPIDRTTRIQIGGGERAHYDLTTTEVDGDVTEVRNGADVIDAGSLEQPWNPYTVDGAFDLIRELDGQGHVAAVFEPDTGVPSALYFDPLPEAIDDELTLHIQVTDIPDTETRDQTSAATQALLDAGANLAEFPGDLADPRLSDLCGTATVTFDSDTDGLDSIVACLSAAAESGDGASAVFTAPTVEGDPIVSLWLVDDENATIFIDNSRDAFAGDPFVWTRLDCTVNLPLPPSDTQFPDAYSTFSC